MSVHQEHWQFGGCEDMLGCATEDHLAQSALGVGTLNQ
jgi:hypothetical protein